MIDLGDWAAEKFRVPAEDVKSETDPDSPDKD
jgi:endogenous inhibitor of DNA gyrase (YacG/DUF329 family)